MNLTTDAILEMSKRARESGERVGGQYQPAELSGQSNEFCLFFKPETFMPGVKSAGVVELVLERLKREAVEIPYAVALPAPYLDSHGIMREHYGVIDRISRHGLESISAEARKKLDALPESGDAEFLGGHQFLERYKFFTPEALAVFYDSGTNNKLAGGTHCIFVTIKGKKTCLFNGFHPEQLDHYIRGGQVIVALCCRSGRDWKSIRGEMTGATNPAKAVEGSLRRILYDSRARIALPEISSGRNVIHVSAGPIEGGVEIARFFGTGTQASQGSLLGTSVGMALLKSGMSQVVLEALNRNPIVAIGDQVGPAFDVTEEIDTWQVLNKAPQIRLI